MSTVHYDGKCERLETAIYGSFLLGVVATQKYIYTSDWEPESGNYNIWKTNKVTGKSNRMELEETTQPQGIGYFVDQYNGKKNSLILFSLILSSINFHLFFSNDNVFLFLLLCNCNLYL